MHAVARAQLGEAAWSRLKSLADDINETSLLPAPITEEWSVRVPAESITALTQALSIILPALASRLGVDVSPVDIPRHIIELEANIVEERFISRHPEFLAAVADSRRQRDAEEVRRHEDARSAQATAHLAADASYAAALANVGKNLPPLLSMSDLIRKYVSDAEQERLANEALARSGSGGFNGKAMHEEQVELATKRATADGVDMDRVSSKELHRAKPLTPSQLDNLVEEAKTAKPATPAK